MDEYRNPSTIFGLLSKYYFDKLDPRWIKDIIDTDFTDIEDLPLEFVEFHSTTNVTGLFDATVKALREWIDQIPQREENRSREVMTFLSTSSIYESDVEQRDIFSQFWMDLNKNFNINAILSYIFYHVYKGMLYDAGETARELSCLASSFYLLLLAIPGSNAFRIFHPVLYMKSVDILRLTTKLNVGASTPKKGQTRGPKPIHRKSTEDEADLDDDDEEVSFLTPQETNKLVRSLNILLNDFLRFAARFSLKHSPESLEETVVILVDVTRSETNNPHSIFINRHGANSVTALAYNSYVALQSVCIPVHGNVEKTVLLVLKSVMPNILMTARGSSDLSPRALGVIREHSVIFVKYLFFQIKDSALRGIYILLQHLCCRVTDRADAREKTAKSVVDILKVFCVKTYTEFLNWLYIFSQNDKAGHRLFTLEIISKLLEEEERSEQSDSDSLAPDKDFSEENEKTLESASSNFEARNPIQQNVLSHRFLLGIIFSRCKDTAATVRAKALALLARSTLSRTPTIIASLKEIFPNVAEPHLPNGEVANESNLQEQSDRYIKLPDKEVLLLLLQRRSLDEKVTVRKSALQVIENLMKMESSMVAKKYLQILEDHCRDPALLIRKQMIVSLTSILEMYPYNEDACNIWVRGVLPLVLDPEIKVQEKVVEVVDAMVFSTLLPFDGCNENDQLCWRIMNSVTTQSYHKFFSKVLMLWCKSVMQKPRIFGTVKTHIGTKYNEQVWTLLALMSQYTPVKSPLFALEYFEQHAMDLNEISSYVLQQVLKVLQYSIKYLPQQRAVILKQKLLEPLVKFQFEVDLISLVVDSISLITNFIEDANPDSPPDEDWAAPILDAADGNLKQIVFSKSILTLNKDEEELFYRQLYTLGDVAMMCPSKVNKRMFLMLQSLIFHDTHNKEPCTTMPSSQTQSSQPPASSFTPTKRIKALAVVTLGKMCLQHESEAKRIIPAMGKLLDTTTLPSLKINIIFVLADICVRYATLVDPLMPQVTACLRDTDVQVRRTTLTLLINLLQEDYLKLKGSFFYRILQCLCDDHEDIKSTVAFYMTERLLKRSPNIFLQHFIECIFHYNCYEEHESYNKFTQSKQEKELFTLAGAQFKEQRMTLYKFMLDHMSDEQRFATTQKLCQDILGGIVDARIRLTPASQPMLEDTLLVLSSDEIKLASLKSRSDDVDQPTDRAEEAALAGIAVRKTLISQVVKQNVIENIVPILITLKHRLEEHKSPLMKQLLLYLKEIMKDYKNEVKEILAGDKQLAKEIEFDLRRIDEQELVLKEAKANERIPKPSLDSAKPKSKESIPHPPTNATKTTEPVIDATKNDDTKVTQSVLDDTQNDGDASKITESEVDATKHNDTKVTESVLDDTQDNDDATKTTESEVDATKQNEDTNITESMVDDPKDSNEETEAKLSSEICDSTDAHINAIKEKLDIEDPSGKEPANDESDAPSSPLLKGPNSSRLLVTALMNSRNIVSRRRSTTHAQSDVRKEDSPKRRRSTVIPEETLADNCDTPKRDKEGERKALMRAISTPHGSKTILQNITFINKSQEMSTICFDPVESDKTDDRILLHLKSPEAFAKDDDFSMLRRGPRRSIAKEFVSKEPSKSVKRPAALFETFSQSANESESSLNSSSVVERRASPRARQTSPPVAQRRTSKRNVSVSPSTIIKTTTKRTRKK